MDLSIVTAAQDLLSFFLGLIVSAVPLYQYLEKNQIIPKGLQKEIQDIINAAERYGTEGYSTSQAQELGELIIRSIAEYNQAAKTAAAKK
jgi:hypothetical protein